MPSFRSERRVRHSAEEMFDLVADVEDYPEFVPLCRALRVRGRSGDKQDVEVLVAEMEVGHRAIHEKFTTRVTLDRPRLKIVVEYVDGPFRRLENVWNFRSGPQERGSTVEFFIAYEFRSRLLGALMGAMFDAAFRKFSAAFEARADEVYARKAD
jgi:coenzyme Q-binding protein COQ10